jgi:hypothetical protein
MGDTSTIDEVRATQHLPGTGGSTDGGTRSRMADRRGGGVHWERLDDLDARRGTVSPRRHAAPVHPLPLLSAPRRPRPVGRRPRTRARAGDGADDAPSVQGLRAALLPLRWMAAPVQAGVTVLRLHVLPQIGDMEPRCGRPTSARRGVRVRRGDVAHATRRTSTRVPLRSIVLSLGLDGGREFDLEPTISGTSVAGPLVGRYPASLYR